MGLRLFGDSVPVARRALAAYVNGAVRQEVQLDFKRGNVKEADALGPDGHAVELLRQGEIVHRDRRSLEQIIAAVCEAYDLQLSSLRRTGRQRRPAEARAMMSYLVRRYGTETVAALGREVNREQSVLTHTAKPFAERMERDSSIAELYEVVQERLGVKEA